jgi:hypothetical protein
MGEDEEVPDESDGLELASGPGFWDYLRFVLGLSEEEADHLHHIWLFTPASAMPCFRYISRPLLRSLLDAVQCFADRGQEYRGI